MMTNAMMNTIAGKIEERLANNGIFVDASAETVVTMIGWEDLKAIGKEARHDLYAYALDRADGNEWWDVCCLVGAYNDEEYYNDNIDAFLEYESHMDEPDFDWSFYSDWHKDMYGYRPR